MSTREPLYRVTCTTAWTGDNFGNEWKCGAAVYQTDTCRFSVFEDDGKGNGTHLATFSLQSDAKRYADLYVKHMDAGGDGLSSEFAEMCRLVEFVGVRP